MTAEITKVETPAVAPAGVFSSIKAFEDAQRMVRPLAESQLVPDTYRGKIGDCIIALEMSQRTGASPLSVMQNMYLVHGRPAWSSQFLVACVNASGKFSPLRYEFQGQQGSDDWGCRAWANDRANGERLDGPLVTIGMAKKEGWMSKNGSKWATMPELMLRYRAATFFTRVYCPEISMGMMSDDEITDITPAAPTATQERFRNVTPAPDALPPENSASGPVLRPDEWNDILAAVAEAVQAAKDRCDDCALFKEGIDCLGLDCPDKVILKVCKEEACEKTEAEEEAAENA